MINTNLKWLRLNFRRDLAALQPKSNSQMKKRVEQYKRHYNTKVQEEPKPLSNRCMINDKRQLTGTVNTADDISNTIYNKLQPQKVGSFWIIDVQPHTVALVIEEHAVQNTVRIHQVTAAPVLYEQPATAQTPSSRRNAAPMTGLKKRKCHLIL